MLGKCDFVRSHPHLIMCAVGFFVPSIIIITCYSVTWVYVKNSSNDIQEMRY